MNQHSPEEENKRIRPETPFSSHVFVLPYVIRNQEKQKTPYSQEWRLLQPDVHEDKLDLPYLIKNTQYGMSDEQVSYAYMHYFNSEAQEITYRKSDLVRNYAYRPAEAEELIYRISYYDGFEEKELDFFDLDVKYIMIRELKSLAAGFLIIAVDNYSYPKMDQVAKINQFGRRVYNPFLVGGDNYQHGEAPTNLQFLTKEEAKQKSAYHSHEKLIRYEFMDGPAKLLQSFYRVSKENLFRLKALDEAEQTNIALDKIVDDRMFVICYYENHYLSKLIQQKSIDGLSMDDLENNTGAELSKEELDLVIKAKQVEQNSSSQNFSYEALKTLYRLAFIDKESASCADEGMIRSVFDDIAYKRWMDYGTLYMVTQHSLLTVASRASAPAFVPTYFLSQYLEMVLIVFSQRIGFLYFSKKTGDEASQPDPLRIRTLQKEYVIFQNQFLLPELSPQEQAVDLYQLLQKQLYVEHHSIILNDQIRSLHEISQTEDAVFQGRRDRHLNIFVAILTIVTIVPIFFENAPLFNLLKKWIADNEILVLSVIGLIIALRKDDLKKWFHYK